MTELWQRDAWEVADAVRRGELTSTELVEASLTRIAERNDELNAVCYLDPDGARARAAEVDAMVARGEDPGPFAGVPIGVKELAQAKGFPDTHASVVYRDDIAPADCPEVAGLRAAGAVITGLTTAPEFGIPSYTATPLHGVTRNPWNLERTPGGSSGGSAAAVAAGLFSACTGSDGGGSTGLAWRKCSGTLAAVGWASNRNATALENCGAPPSARNGSGGGSSPKVSSTGTAGYFRSRPLTSRIEHASADSPALIVRERSVFFAARSK